MSPATRPNFLLLVAEDTGCHQGCYGNALAHTPALDRLASEGCRFTHAFSTAPVCAPSRGTMVTGQYAWAIGNHHMRSKLRKPPRLFTEELRDAGYYVNWANKTDFNFDPPESFADGRHEWFEDLAEGRLPDQSWLLYHNFGDTHESGCWASMWEDGHRHPLPPEEACDPATVEVPPYLPDTPEVRANIARYQDNLTTQDKQIARALDALERSGQAANTIVLYFADHGRGLPREKRWLYDAGIRLPLIVRWPGEVEPGTVRHDLVSWVDIAPTILAAAGVSIPADYAGEPFVGPAARQEEREWCLAARDRMGEPFDRCRALRDRQFLYIRNDFPWLPYAQVGAYHEKIEAMTALREARANGTLTPAQQTFMADAKPPEELYDCDADPWQIHNLAADPAHRERLETMRTKLAELLAETGDLGLEPESALIQRGLVEDVIQQYRDRLVDEVPERYRIGRGPTVLEMEDALAQKPTN